MADEISASTAALWFCALLAGGIVKGATGFGVPLIALPLLSLVWPVPTAIVTLVMPIFVSNVFLVYREGMRNVDARPLLALIILMVIGIFAGARFLAEANETLLYRSLGTIVVCLALFNLTRARLVISPQRQRFFNPIIGLVAGVIGGMSTLMGPVLIPYLSSLGLAPNVFVATISFIYLIGIIFVSLAFASFGIVSYEDFSISIAAVFPVLLGLWLGAKIRERLSVERFLFVIDVLLVFIGLSLFAKG